MFQGVGQKISVPLGASDTEGEGWTISDALCENSEQWDAPEEGKLSVDVAETDDVLIISAPMAGTPPSNIELHLHNDLLTIRGERSSPVPADARYFHHECYWGKFSRTVVLPSDVRVEMAEAEYRNGVLTIRLPKIITNSNIPIMIMDE